MDLDESRALLAIERERTISGAATRLGVSRATVRRRLAALEARLGVDLARSTENGVELTAAGEMYAKYARGPVRELDAVAELTARAGTEPSGCLDVAVPLGAGARLGPQLVRLLFERWPQLRVRVRATSHPVSHLDAGADVALSLTLPATGELVTHAIGHVSRGLFASEAYLDAHGRPRSLDDLARHTLLHTVADADSLTLGQHDHVLLPLVGGGVHDVQPKLVSTDTQFIGACAADGLGVALLPTLASEALTHVLPRLVGDRRTIWAVTTRAGALLPRARAGLEALTSILADLDPVPQRRR